MERAAAVQEGEGDVPRRENELSDQATAEGGATEEGSAPALGAPSAVGECNVGECSTGAQVFVGEWDDEGVYFYQAFCDEVADWAR